MVVNLNINEKAIAKYNDLKNNPNSERSDIHYASMEVVEHYRYIEHNSLFNANMIGRVLAELMTNYEYVQYQLKHIDVCKSEKDSNGKEIKIANILGIEKQDGVYQHIIAEKSIYFDEGANNEFKKGNLFILQKQPGTLSDGIHFYRCKYKRTSVTEVDNITLESLDFGPFEYVKSFINMVINYEMANNIDLLSESQLYLLVKKFLLDNIDELRINYRKNIARSQDEIEQGIYPLADSRLEGVKNYLIKQLGKQRS